MNDIYRLDLIITLRLCIRYLSSSPRNPRLFFNPDRRFGKKLSLYRKLTPGPQLGSQEIQRPHPTHACTGQTRQQTNALANTQFGKKGVSEQNGAGGEGRTAEIIGGEKGGGVGRIGQGHVEEYALQDDEDPHGEDADGHHAADPVDGGVGCPACAGRPRLVGRVRTWRIDELIGREGI